MKRAICIGGLCWLPTLLIGCHEEGYSRSIWNPLGLKLPFSPEVEPVRIGVEADGTAFDIRAWWDIQEKTPWTEFRRELSRHIHKPVQIVALKPFQICHHLETGRLAFALLTDQQFVEVEKEKPPCKVIARANTLDRAGVIVAKAGSGVKSIEDIAGKRFSFGPRGDPLLHYAAAAALSKQGVSVMDIKRELVPINSLQYHLNSVESAKEIAFGTTPAGVIEESEYASFAPTGGRLLPLAFSKDQFVVLAEVKPLDLGPVIASDKADPALVNSVKAFLVSAETKRPRVMASLGIVGFTGVESADPINESFTDRGDPQP